MLIDYAYHTTDFVQSFIFNFRVHHICENLSLHYYKLIFCNDKRY